MIQNPKEARQLASYILDNFEFYGEFYFKLEDWLTEVLQGNKPEPPRGIEGEYLACALRIELKDFFDNKNYSYNAEDIEECVDRIINHCSVNVLDMDFISDIVDEYLDERIEYLTNKERVCPLDKEERLWLYEIQNRKSII